jgi:streptogramin lyase
MDRVSSLGRRAVAASLIAAAAALSWPASALAIDEYPIPTPASKPGGISLGPDGALWFTEEAHTANKIGRVSTGGVVSEFGGLSPAPLPTTSLTETGPTEITLGPDGNLWFTEIGNNKIGRITPTGVVTEFSVPGATPSRPDGIVAGPDDRLWFTQSNSSQIGAITTTGVVDEYPLPAGSNPGDITVGPDGKLWFTEGEPANKIGVSSISGSILEFDLPAGGDPSGITASAGALWFTEFAGDKIGRIPTSGGTQNITEYNLAPGSGPSSITTGSDGALWFTETTANKIGRITTGGSVTEFVVPTPGSDPGGIAAGPDNAIWFTEFLGNKIGRIAVGSSVVPPLAPPPSPPPVGQTKRKTCKVPKLKRLKIKKARAKLRKAGCRYKIRGKGKRVVSTKPKAGRRTSGVVQVNTKKPKKKRRRAGRR